MGRMRLNVMMSRRRQVIGAGTGSAGTQSLSGRVRQGSTATDLGGCSSRECARVFIVVRDPNKVPLNMLVCLVCT